jgi:hypothetical protein
MPTNEGRYQSPSVSKNGTWTEPPARRTLRVRRSERWLPVLRRSGLASLSDAQFTVTWTLVAWLRLPELPVIVSVYVPELRRGHPLPSTLF